ncbi:MAG: hypothetical protein ACRER5_16130 [Pseudomonas sp.]
MFDSTVAAQFDLTLPAPGTDDAQECPEAPAANVPHEITALESVYRAQIQLCSEINARAAALRQELSSIYGMQYERVEIEASIDRSFFQKQIERVTTVANARLSTPTAAYEPGDRRWIQPAWDAYQNWYCRDGDDSIPPEEVLVPFSPVALWLKCVEHHDPQSIENKAARLDARTIAYAFGVIGRRAEQRNQQMKVVKGRVEICIDVYTARDFSGDRRLNSDCLTRLGAAMEAAQLRCGGGHEAIGRNLRSLGDRLHYNREFVISRKRDDLGGGADIVHGHNTFKLYLPTAVAQELNMYVAEYRDGLEDYC